MNMTEKEKIIIGLMQHFHEESSFYGGWPIIATKDMLSVIKKELKNSMELFEKNNIRMVRLKNNHKWNPKYEVLMFKDERDLYKEAESKLYYGIKALVD